ncbi:MAG: prepilin-type N-terminal cleavage/methylation domain-containing protein [Clostridium sp.]
MNKLKKRRKGFTLIEMVVVIAIVVIIAAIAIPQALKAINKSKASTDVANARTYSGEIMSKVANSEIVFGDGTGTTKAKNGTVVSLLGNAAEGKLVKGTFYYKVMLAGDTYTVKETVDNVEKDVTKKVSEDTIFISISPTGTNNFVEANMIYPTASGEWANYVK